MLTLVAGTASISETSLIIARFAFPSTAGAVTRQADSLSPHVVACRKGIVLCTGSNFQCDNRTIPVFQKSISDIWHGCTIRKGMLPGINAHGSPVACCRSSPVFKPCRASPVAHPGCPVDHIQTLVNQSPGDLWMRCIGSILFVFCYLALGDELIS